MRLVVANGRRTAAAYWSLLLLGSLAALAEEPFRASPDRLFDIEHIRLDLEVNFPRKEIAGTATINGSLLRKARWVALDAADHEVAGVEDVLASKKLSHDNTGKKIRIDLGEEVALGTKKTLLIRYRAREPKEGLHFFAPTPDHPDTPTMVWSQGEPISNRGWFPCLDHPNEFQTTELVVTVENGFEVLSNGVLKGKSTLADGRVRFHWAQEKPHVAYLVTMVVGKFAVATKEWRRRPVTFYLPPHRADDTERTFGRTLPMLDFFSQRFGIEYPWPKYAQVVVEQFIAGGMENTTATTMYSGLVHNERALLDSSPDGLIAHELAHQWWGDLLTCKDWAHLWLNEGFATYAEFLWQEHHKGRDEADLLLFKRSQLARSGGALTRPVVDRHYHQPGDMFDSRSYPKGAWILHMLRHQLGDEIFFDGLKIYAETFRHQAVETSDLRKTLERRSGQSLERFFYEWTERPGHPILSVTTQQDDPAQVKVTIKQTQSGEPFHFTLPIEIQFEAPTAAVTLSPSIENRELTLFAPTAAKIKMVRVDPRQTILAEINEEKSQSLWTAQALGSVSVPERLRAIQHLAKSKTPADRDVLISILKSDAFHGVRAEAARGLGEPKQDVARDALLGRISDPDPYVRRAVMESLGTVLHDTKVIEALERKIKEGDQSYFVEAAALSALAKVNDGGPAAPYLAALGRESHQDVIRAAALEGLGLSRDSLAFPALLDAAQPTRRIDSRQTAIAAIATYIVRNDVSGAPLQKGMDRLVTGLSDSHPRIRRASASALRDLGRVGRPAEQVLLTLSERDPDGRVREFAAQARTAIRADSSSQAELVRLRDQLDKLKKADLETAERLQKLENPSLPNAKITPAPAK